MIHLLNGLLSALSVVAQAVLKLLPDSPFQSFTLPSGVDTVLGWLNWFVPVADICAFLAVYIVAVIGYKVVQWILRLLHYIQ